jgi:hypothetical protein
MRTSPRTTLVRANLPEWGIAPTSTVGPDRRRGGRLFHAEVKSTAESSRSPVSRCTNLHITYPALVFVGAVISLVVAFRNLSPLSREWHQ